MNKIILKNARIFDAVHWGVVCDVLVENDTIADVSQKPLTYSDAVVKDMSGFSVFPGFIDAHLHLVSGAGVLMEEPLKNYAQSGITAVRDLGVGVNVADKYIKWRAEHTGPEYCEIISAGVPLTKRNGVEYVAPRTEGTPDYACDNAAEARNAVDALLDAGFEGIKTRFEVTLYGPAKERGAKNLSLDELSAITDQAAKHGCFVCAHVLESQLIPLLINGGIRELAHVPTDYLPDEMIRLLIENEVVITPTLSVNVSPPPPLPEKLPPEMQWMYEAAMTPEKLAHYDLHANDNLTRFIKAGGKVAVGTDTMRFEELTEPKGIPVTELRLLKRAGMSVQNIIIAATMGSAKVSFVNDRMGSIKARKEANIVAIFGELDDNFEALKNVDFVMNKGVIIKDKRSHL